MKAQEHKSIIEVNHISKDFKVYKRIGIFKRENKILRVVNDINFDIKESEIVAFLGPNGAGKSTTIKMMTGILTPSYGNIVVNGIVPYNDRVKNAKNIGAVFGQRTSLWTDLSVEDNFILLKEMYEISNEEYEERMRFFDKILDIKKLFYKQVRTLSLGQRMLADLVASLLHKPKILYLDEPTIGLDIILKEKLINILKEIHKIDKITIILTTHDMRDVKALCNRIIVINKGQKIYDDSIKKLKEKYVKNRVIKAKIRNDSKIDEIELVIDNNEIAEKTSIIDLYNKYEVLKIEIEEENIDNIIKRIYEEK